MKHPATKYGEPAADQILINRYFVIGYSYYFRQAKWALEIIDNKKSDVDRADDFRPDYRIPPMFRADLVDYRGSGYDRGHLVSSANHRETLLQNSETFLLSNMSPQRPELNRRIWRELEDRLRDLDSRPEILETFVICGPIFYFDKEVKMIGTQDENQVSIPVPHAFFKSALCEDYRGRLKMYSFILPNETQHKPLDEYMCPVKLIEKLAGIKLWSILDSNNQAIRKEKAVIHKPWW